MAHEILTTDLLDTIQHQSRGDQSEWLFLEPSTEFTGCWEVDGLWPEWFIDLQPVVGNYRLVTPAGLQTFLNVTDERGYKVVFTEPPEVIIDAYKHLNEKPVGIRLKSTLPQTVRGFLPWQIVGFNKLVKDEGIRAGYVVWDTGAGKTGFIAAAVKYHMEIAHPFNLALVIVKSHNKIETQRKLYQLGGIESTILDGYKLDKRYDRYEELQERILSGESFVGITNYEKFREDAGFFKVILEDQRCLFFWDEAPTKLSNRSTQLYKSVQKALYQRRKDKEKHRYYFEPRTSWARHWILTATPIENSPEDVFSCVNLVWPGLLGNVNEFYLDHAGYTNPMTRKVQTWRNLDRLEAKLQFITHRVSKEDPEVKDMFPRVIPMPKIVDWNPKHLSVYNKLAGKAVDLLDELEDANILALIQVMQMMCDAPSMIGESAKHREAFNSMLMEGDLDPEAIKWASPKGSDIAIMLTDLIGTKAFTDMGHTKLETWREIICEKHPNDKIVTHSTWAQYIFPVWEYYLQRWGVSYVLYAGTPKEKQTALDAFRNDPSIRLFLSGDGGADSIDIPQACIGVNYNIPWKWTTLKQREGRRDRVDSTFDHLYTYTLIMADSVDERKLEICEMKHQYHEAVFDGRAIEESFSASMTREDLTYILTGQRPDEP